MAKSLSRLAFTIAVAVSLVSPLAAFGAATNDQQSVAERLKGHILLQVQARGQAWYVRTSDGLRYYMADGAAAYQMMRGFSLGITDADLAKIPSVATTSEMKASAPACAANASANAVRGNILLQVQKHGEAWYVDPVKCRAIYMADGAAAYAIMRYLSLGITDADLDTIPVGTVPAAAAASSASTDAASVTADTTTPADAAAAAAVQDQSAALTDTSASDYASTYVSPETWSTGGGDALTTL